MLNLSCINITFVWEDLIFKLHKSKYGCKDQERYNQVPHLTQDTNGTPQARAKRSAPASDHKAHINRRAQRHSKHKTEKKHIKDAHSLTLSMKITDVNVTLCGVWVGGSG